MKKRKKKWLKINERTDVIASLTVFSLCLSKVDNDPLFWKQLILSLHNALQGAMVCCLTGTANLGALNKKTAGKIEDWHERNRIRVVSSSDSDETRVSLDQNKFERSSDPYPEPRLADATTLFERLCSDPARQDILSKSLAISEDQKRSFQRLHLLRNDLMHLTPQDMSIELAGLPRIFTDMLAVIKTLSEDEWAFRHLSNSDRATLRKLIKSSQTLLAMS